MRISSIQVDKLFGVFNHRIECNLHDRITIIYGPNGIGKTVILSLLNSLFKRSLSPLQNTPFQRLILKFEDGQELIISQLVRNDELPLEMDRPTTPSIDLEFSIPGSKLKLTYPQRGLRSSMISHIRESVDEWVPMLNRVSMDTWTDHRVGDTINFDEVILRYGDRLPPGVSREMGIPDWLDGMLRSLSVRFIQANRLVLAREPRRARRDESDSFVIAVQSYSKDLTEIIQAKLAEYASYSQNIDRTFPNRLMETPSTQVLSEAELVKKFEELDRKSKRLTAVGLLEEEKTMSLRQFKPGPESAKRQVLTLHLADWEQKLGVLDSLADRIDLMITIVNSRFASKRMSVNKQDGFVFTTNGRQILRPSQLSSGEQNELVILYELLFKTPENSLVLIDEPELSLHVLWQQQFLNDLLRIASLSQFDALIATHSPFIIHDRDDLTVGLKGANGAGPSGS